MVVGSSETVAYIIERAREDGEEYLPEQVHAVVEIQLAYMRAIGAIGGRAVAPEASPGTTEPPG